ncbi:MAG: FAD-dependent oxidoreductase, partial [Mycolicibacterium sp.]|nr:FAD-dependent oxidoreductase [Mycolicibacterium sp.]
MADVVVVGAGFSGLTTARLLTQRGLEVVVVAMHAHRG